MLRLIRASQVDVGQPQRSRREHHEVGGARAQPVYAIFTRTAPLFTPFLRPLSFSRKLTVSKELAVDLLYVGLIVLFFAGSAALVVEAQNVPCRHAGCAVSRRTERPGDDLTFPKAARCRRA